MRIARITVLLLMSAAIAGCAYVPLDERNARRISVDYRAAGATDNVQAFVYGNRTVLAISGLPPLVVIKDESGTAVDYDRIGSYYRLARRLDNFTAWINGRPATFSATPAMRVFSSSLPVTKPADPASSALLAMLQLSARQLSIVRELVKDNPQLWKKMKTRYWAAKSGTVWINFPANSTSVTPDAEFSRTMIEAARNAEKIILRGRTDTVVVGSMGAQIAKERALAVRKLLVENGVKPSKIQVLSKSTGDFLVPNDTEKGRALNRRVEIEITSSCVEVLKQFVPIRAGFI